jgi:multiple sugar transport system substrate-binding protein
MQKWSRVLVGAVVLLMVLSAIGCQPSNTGQVTIHILTMDQAGLKPAEIDQIVADFEELHPDINVEMEYVGYDYVHDKIVTGMAADPPGYDAAMIDVIWPDEFIDAGYLLDVTDRVTPEMRDGIFPAAWNGVTRNDRIYGMPWLMDQKYFMYNQAMLEQAGFNEPPQTWEELIQMAKRKASFATLPFCCSATAGRSWMPTASRSSTMPAASKC